MRIAIITAMAEETLPIYQKLGNIIEEQTISGVKVRQIEIENDTIYLATSGIGEIRAALAVQMLVDLFDVEIVLNFGFVGALSNNLDISELVIVDKICHHQFDLSAINGTKLGQYENKDTVYFQADKTIIDKVLSNLKKEYKQVIDASGDKFVASDNDKKHLKSEFNADICEMETAGLAIACERNNIPLFSMKVVSDKADGSASMSFNDVLKKGITKYEKVLPDVLSAISKKQTPLPPIKKQ